MKIYTDGATSRNGQENAPGGWAFIIVDRHGNVIDEGSGHVDNATNNICELLAVINACQAYLALEDGIVTVYSDSAYIVNCYKQKWYEVWQQNGWRNSKKEPVKNKELWEQLIPYFENFLFSFEKVKGHAGNYFNEKVDAMAVEAKNNG